MQTSVATYNTTISALFYGENFCGERQLSWDEENRLRSICDNGYISSYFYDAAGERTVKLHGSGEGIHVNSAFSGGYTNNVDYTLYVDAYMVLEKGGQYTKHIYIGDQRIVSKLGDVGSFGVDPRREQYAGEDVAGVEVPDYKTKYEALQNVIKDNYQLFEVDYYGIDNDNYVDGAGFCCEPKAQAKNARSLPTENVDYEKLQYYYHSDHLGSASYITNLDGEVVQHIEYVPFGEVFLEERNNTWNTPFLFNGKELDEETGLYYYGARYYNPRTSLWLSVDPIATYNPVMETEHYIDGQHNGGVFNAKNLNVYGYCYQNPVILVDPNGKQVYFGTFNRLNYKGKGAVGKTGTFIANSGISIANGFIGIWNYAGDLTDPENPLDISYSANKIADDAVAVKRGVQSYIKNTSWDEFKDDVGDLATNVETYENLLGALVGAKGLDKLSKLGKVSSAAKSSSNLMKSATQLDKGGLTKVGRALQKHGSRQGSVFPKATGNPASMNAQGKSVLQNIVNNPNATTVTRHHGRFGNIMEIKIPNGQGARFSADGKTFFGFIE